MKFKKHFLFLCLLIIPLLLLAKVTYPKPVGFVNDFAGVLSSETKLELDNLLTELREKTNVDIAVVTVDNMQGLDRDTYAVELFKEWKIGSKNDEGLLFLLAKEERQTKVEVGYGLEGLINDAKAGRVLDEYAVPFFKKNDFDSGLKSATIVFSEIIANDKGVTLTGVAEVTQVDEKSSSSTRLLVVL